MMSKADGGIAMNLEECIVFQVFICSRILGFRLARVVGSVIQVSEF